MAKFAGIQTIEDRISEALSGENQENVRGFVSFMRANGFSFEGFQNGDETWWNPACEGEGIGCAAIPEGKGEFWLWIGLELDLSGAVPTSDAMKENILSHVVICPQDVCSPPYCQKDDEHPGCKNHFNIFGVEYESTCHAPLAFFNPDAETLEDVKALLLMAVGKFRNK